MVSASIPSGVCNEFLAYYLEFGSVGFFGDGKDGCSHTNKKQWGGVLCRSVMVVGVCYLQRTSVSVRQ